MMTGFRIVFCLFSLTICCQASGNDYGGHEKTIHVLVALCDNKYQGIAPVPASMGNGQNQDSNLYWGAAYGMRSYFKKSKEWDLIAVQKGNDIILERLIFKHAVREYYLVADAYNGQYIRQCILDFLNSSCGSQKDIVQMNNKNLGINGNAALLVYIGHNGLMDFQLPHNYVNIDKNKRDVIILACYSKRFFSPLLNEAGVHPLLWTTGLMCPEAYTLHDALTGYVHGENYESIHTRAAEAYAKYQKCALRAARGLLVTGW